MDVFSKYKQALEAYGVDCVFRPGDEDFPIPLLIADLGEDEYGRERKLSIRYSDVPLQPDAEELNMEIELESLQELQKNQSEAREVFTHFFTALPFSYEDKALGELSRLLLFLNKGMDFPGWGLNEADGEIYFHHVLHSPKQVETPRLIVGVVGMIIMMLDSMSDSIESVARGDQTLAELAQQMLEIAKDEQQ